MIHYIIKTKQNYKISKWKKDTEFEVPSTVKEIGNSCFSSCGNLVKIQITSNVEN